MWYSPIIKNIIIDELIKLSPVPVDFVSKNKIGVPNVANAIRIGVFYSKKSEQIRAYIEVSNKLSKYLKIATLLHEIGHAKCSIKRCKCSFNVSAEGEIHANEYALNWLLKNKHKKILRVEMKHIKNNFDRVDYYGEAARCIINSKLWQKCLKYTGKL